MSDASKESEVKEVEVSEFLKTRFRLRSHYHNAYEANESLIHLRRKIARTLERCELAADSIDKEINPGRYVVADDVRAELQKLLTELNAAKTILEGTKETVQELTSKDRAKIIYLQIEKEAGGLSEQERAMLVQQAMVVRS